MGQIEEDLVVAEVEERTKTRLIIPHEQGVRVYSDAETLSREIINKSKMKTKAAQVVKGAEGQGDKIQKPFQRRGGGDDQTEPYPTQYNRSGGTGYLGKNFIPNYRGRPKRGHSQGGAQGNDERRGGQGGNHGGNGGK